MHPYLFVSQYDIPVALPLICVTVHATTILGSNPSLQFIQMLQSRKHYLLTRLFDLAREKDLVQNCVDLFHMAY